MRSTHSLSATQFGTIVYEVKAARELVLPTVLVAGDV